MLMLWVRQTVFHVTLGRQLPPHPKVERRALFRRVFTWSILYSIPTQRRSINVSSSVVDSVRELDANCACVKNKHLLLSFTADPAYDIMSDWWYPALTIATLSTPSGTPLYRLIADLVLTYRIIFGLIDLNMSDYFTLQSSSCCSAATRGNPYKLLVNHCRINVRKHFFQRTYH